MEPSDQQPLVGEAVVRGRRPVVIAALPLRRTARERLGELLDATVLDIREPVDDPDLVLTPSVSPQLIGGLKRRFPGAAIIVVELSDWELDIDLGGPVKRILNSGADAYLLADSLDDLAHKLGGARATAEFVPWTAHELTGPTMDDLVAAFLDESVTYAQRHQSS